MRRSKALIGTLVVVGALTAYSRAEAEEASACTNNLAQFDVCAQAEKLKAEFSADLQQKRIGRGVYKELDVRGATLTFTVAWQLPAKDLAQFNASGQAAEPLRAQMAKLANDAVCKDLRSAAMSRLGAAYAYRFTLPDGRLLSDVAITECPRP